MNPRFKSFLYAYQNAPQPIKELVDSGGIGNFIKELQKDIPADIAFRPLLIVATNHVLGITNKQSLEQDIKDIGVNDSELRTGLTEAITVFAQECKRLAKESVEENNSTETPKTATPTTDTSTPHSPPEGEGNKYEPLQDVSAKEISQLRPATPKKVTITSPTATATTTPPPKEEIKQEITPPLQKNDLNNNQNTLPKVRTMRTDAASQQPESQTNEEKVVPLTPPAPTPPPTQDEEPVHTPTSQEELLQKRQGVTTPIPPKPAPSPSAPRWKSEATDQ